MQPDSLPCAQTATQSCPCCGLLCDDLPQQPIDMLPCRRAQQGFTAAQQRLVKTSVNGKAAADGEAIKHAASLLCNAKNPLFSGLATDVAGMRATMLLADRCGAVVDHAGSPRGLLNMMQREGVIGTSLATLHRHADLVLLLGSNLETAFPRLSRFLSPTLVANGRLWRLTETAASSDCSVSLSLANSGALADRLLLAARDGEDIADTPTAQLLAALREARYTVVVLASDDFNFVGGDLVLQAWARLLRHLNRQQRAAMLALGGHLATVTTQQVCTWQSGFPTAVRLGRNGPHYDAENHHWEKALSHADLVLWITALDAEFLPPVSDCPTILLAHPAARPSSQMAVVLPVGVPGIHHRALLFRGDAVRVQCLSPQQETGPPAVAQRLQAISKAMAAGGQP